MVRIEIPVVVTKVKDQEVAEVMGTEESIETFNARALIFVEHICYVLEQPDGSATISMQDGEEFTTDLKYTDIKTMLADE